MMVNDVFGCEKKEYGHRWKKKATYDGYDLSHSATENSKHVTPPPFPRRGTSLYGLYRYVRPQRVWFFSRFDRK